MSSHPLYDAASLASSSAAGGDELDAAERGGGSSHSSINQLRKCDVNGQQAAAGADSQDRAESTQPPSLLSARGEVGNCADSGTARSLHFDTGGDPDDGQLLESSSDDPSANTRPSGQPASPRRPASVDKVVTATIVNESQDTKVDSHWQSMDAFVIEEKTRRVINENVDGDYSRVFFSHCWRNPETQVRKRRIVAELSKPIKDGGPGLSYWGDWADLQARGPIPWREEISNGIAACSKFVAFVDEAWLTSYNCLEELVLALHHCKPIVVLVLDQGAWDLLTVPGGPAKAKGLADKAHGCAAPWQAGGSGQTAPLLHTPLSPQDALACAGTAWQLGRHGPALCEYEGVQIVAGQTMSLDTLMHLFKRLSSINLCPCRELEEVEWGFQRLLANAVTYVTQDLAHHRQHAHLKSKALAWEQAVRDREPEPLLQPQEAEHWRLWLAAAKKHGTEPPPTELQERFVQESMRRSLRQRRVMSALKVGLILVLLAAAVSSTALTIWALRAARTAEAEAARAEDALLEAQTAEANARVAEDDARREARNARAAEGRAAEEAQRAVMATREALASSVGSSVNRKPHAAEWELKLLWQALSRLPSADSSAATNVSLVSAGQALLQKQHAFVRQVLPSPSLNVTEDNTGHPGARSSAWSPDGRLLAAGFNDPHVVAVWSMDSKGAALEPGSPQVLQGHTDWVVGVAFAPCGCSLASASRDGTVLLWAVDTGGVQDAGAPQVLQGPASAGTLQAVAWAPDGRHLAAAGSHALRVWLLAADGRAVNDSTRLEPQRLLDVDSDDLFDAFSVAWAPSGMAVAAGDGSNQVCVWSVDHVSGQISDTAIQCSPKLSSDVRSVAWSVDSRHLAAAYGSRVVVWPADTSGVVDFDPANAQQLLRHLAHGVRSVAWAPGGRSLASADTDGWVYIWEATSGPGAEQPFEETNVPQELQGSDFGLQSVSWAPDGRSLAAAAWDGRVVLWAFGEAGTVDGAAARLLTDPTYTVNAVAWSPDGRQLASGDRDNIISVWAVERGDADRRIHDIMQPPQTLVAYVNPPATEMIDYRVKAVAWSPKGRHLACTSGDVLVWSIDSSGTATDAAQPLRLSCSRAFARSLAFSPDSMLLAAGTDDSSVCVWDASLRNLEPLQNLEADMVLDERTTTHGDISAVAWTPDSQSLASSSSSYFNIVNVWRRGSNGLLDPESRQILHGHSDDITSLAWSPNGRSLASASHDGSVRIWQADSHGTVTASSHQIAVQGQLGSVHSVAWAPDGRSMATGSEDATVRVWTAASSGQIDESIAPLVLQSDARRPVRAVAWAPDGRNLAAGDEGNNVQVWGLLRVDDVQAALASLHMPNHTLTSKERVQSGVASSLFEFDPTEPPGSEVVQAIASNPAAQAPVEQEAAPSDSASASLPTATATPAPTAPAPPCAIGCPDAWLGDGECDILCNTPACGSDGGDCLQSAGIQTAPGALCAASAVVSTGTAKKPHCSATVQSGQASWQLQACASDMCRAAGCAGGVYQEAVDDSSGTSTCSLSFERDDSGSPFAQLPALPITAICSGMQQPPVQRFGGYNSPLPAVLSRRSFTWTPVSAGDGSLCIGDNGLEPGEAEGVCAGTALTLGDDSYHEIALQSFCLALGGDVHCSACVSSNGFISFGSCSSAYSASLAEHFAAPAISAFRTDLSPAPGSICYWESEGEGLTVAFHGVQLYGESSSSVSFRVQLRPDGAVTVRYGAISGVPDNKAVLVGVSHGGGQPSSGYQGVDLLASQRCRQ